MKRFLYRAALMAGVFCCPFVPAQTNGQQTSTVQPGASQRGTTPSSPGLTAPGSPAARPADATGLCKDGTSTSNASKSGACRGHKGVKIWYAATVPPALASPSATPAPNPAATADPAAPAPVARNPSPSTQARTQTQAAAQAAGQSDTPPPTQSIGKSPATPGGGPGLVWVNTASHTYHCPGSDFYGKTKTGAYMTEAEAKAKGAHGVRGKSCSK